MGRESGLKHPREGLQKAPGKDTPKTKIIYLFTLCRLYYILPEVRRSPLG